jgi:hypothetical protein
MKRFVANGFETIIRVDGYLNINPVVHAEEILVCATRRDVRIGDHCIGSIFGVQAIFVFVICKQASCASYMKSVEAGKFLIPIGSGP